MTRTFTSHASHARSLNLMSPISACSCCVSIEDPPAEQAGLIIRVISRPANALA
jgi:hypothetical protein